MARQRDLGLLLADLHSFLLLLDRESLSAAARAKKQSLGELLQRLQGPAAAEDAEYMMMRCLSPSSGTPQGRAAAGAAVMDARGGRACEHRQDSAQSSRVGSEARGSSPPPPAEGSYEETKPLSCAGHDGADTDSSHYESYGEDEDGVTDRAHYLRCPPARPPPADPPGRPEAQLCGFLWRKLWLGRWAKQLFVVREHTLLGFRCAADLQPALQLDLRGCRVAYKEKRGRRLQHALKVEGAAGEALLIGFPSRQQAEDWRKVWRCCSPAELGAGRWERSAAGGCRRARGWRKGRHAGGAAHAGSRPHGAWGCSVGLQCSPSPLCQVIQEVSSSSPSGPAACSPPASPCRAFGRAANPKQEEDGARRSPSRSPTEDSKGGFLAVRLRWQRLWCAARRGALRMFPEPGGAPRRPSPRAVLRDGCDVTATGPPQRLHVARRVREFAVLQARPDEEGEAWLKSPPAKGGGSPAGANPCAETPGRSPAAGGLLLRRIPTPNAYMDDPFGQPPASAAPRRLSSNTERLQRLQHSLDRAVRGQRRRPTSAAPGGSAAPPHGAAAVPQARQRDEGSPQLHTRDFFRSQRTLTLPPRKGTRDGLDFLTGKRAGSRLEKGGLKAGSELTLLPHRKAPAASSEGFFLSPLLKRSASAKSAWKRPASAGGAERGKVLQARKEWEMKAAM